MQLTSLSSNVQLVNVGQTTGMMMETNEFSFRVLADGLYQNKIGSPVRELSCNGLDSHTMAGKGDVPIVLHLPDADEPFFSVQDFGVGLDDRGVRLTLGTFFKSTKRKDNSAVGAFGLGSKTPFAYTDVYTIVAVKDGRKRQYSAFIAENGKPSLTNMGGEFSATYELIDDPADGETVGKSLGLVDDQWDTTDEGNGVTIMIPVINTSDFYRFRTEVKNQLAFFPVKPKIRNCDSIQWLDWQAGGNYMDLGNVYVGDRNAGGNFHGMWIVQGPVGYKADVELIKQSISPNNREFLEIVGERGLLRFDLGQVEVTPSREGLSYSKKTIAAIETLLDTARVNMTDKVQSQVDALGDAWATACGINQDNTLRRLCVITRAKFEAEGYYKTGSYYHLDLEKIANLEGLAPADNVVTGMVALDYDATWNSDDEGEEEETTDAVQLADLLNLQFRQYSHERTGRRGRVSKWREAAVGRHAKADRTFKVLVRDTAHKPVVRIRTWMASQSQNCQVYVLQGRNGQPVTAAELDAIKARIGASWTPELMSDVTLPERETSGYRSGYKAPTAFTFSAGDNINDTTDWERESEKLKEFDGAYYVTVYRNQTNAISQDSIVFKMAASGLLDKPVMAVRVKDEARILDNPNWIPVRVKADEIVESVKGNKALVNARRTASLSTDITLAFMDSDVAAMLKAACDAGDIPASSPLHRLFRVSRSLAKVKARAARAGYNSITELAMHYAGIENNYTDVSRAVNNRVKKLSAPVNETYPLLAFLHSNSSNGYKCPTTQREHILAYVNAVTGA